MIWSREPRHHRGVGRRRPPTPTRRPVGRRPAAGVEYRAEHAVRPTARRRCCWSPTTTRSSSAWSRCPVPRDRRPGPHAPGAPVRPEDPAERLERVDAFAGHVVLSLRTRRRAPAAPAAARRAGRAAGIDVGPSRVRRTATVGLARNTWYDASCGHGHRPVLRAAAGAGPTSTSPTGGRTETAPRRGAGPRPGGATSREVAHVPGPGRHAGARDRRAPPATPRSTARRPRCSTATAPTSTPSSREWDPALP